MTRKSAEKKPDQRKPKARKFYIISYNLAHKRADFEVENLTALHGSEFALRPPEGERGFPIYPEKPRVVIGKRKSGPPPSDIELYHAYWLISDRLKSTFESVDPLAFAFQACDVRLRDGSAGPTYWLCDVVRVLEAFGEEILQEVYSYRQATGNKYFDLLGRKEDLIFNETVIGQSHVFVTPYSLVDVFCDQRLKDTCDEIGIKGVRFYKCFRG